MSFFSIPKNLEALRICVRTLQGYINEPNSNKFAIGLISIFELVILNAKKFDDCCQLNIEWIGERFMLEVNEFPDLPGDKKHEAITSIFLYAFRFLCELEFVQPGDPSFEVRKIGEFIDENSRLFTEDQRRQIAFARYSMPIQIVKKIVNDPAIAEFRKFCNSVENATRLKTEWDSELNQRRAHVDAIKASLQEVTASYNFVGLVNGFKHLAGVKIEERKTAFCALIWFAFFMILLPVFQIFYILTHMDAIGPKKDVLIYTLPAILTIEVILLYFFRIVLGQFRSVKTQLLQIDLRMALCQFVQSYAEYSAKVKKDDPNALAKFEAVVFSSLVPESDSIPSTFDGAEQLANLIKSIRGT